MVVCRYCTVYSVISFTAKVIGTLSLVLLLRWYAASIEETKKMGQLCPIVPPGLEGPIKVERTPKDWGSLETTLSGNLSVGGAWKPKTCKARRRAAIVIPYRDREHDLKLFMQNMHAFLQKQQLDYTIYVIEQAPNTQFNRAMLKNIGFEQVSRLSDYDCFIFHDVDIYPENDKNIYTCVAGVLHLAAANQKYGYKLPHEAYIGGAFAMTKKAYTDMNGLSNKFFGWGGEDVDFYRRVLKTKLKIVRYPDDIARYAAPPHKQDPRSSPDTKKRLTTWALRTRTDGLNSMIYQIISIEKRPLYTWIYVDIDQKLVQATDSHIIANAGKRMTRYLLGRIKQYV